MKGHYAKCFTPTNCWCEVKRYALVLGIVLAVLVLEIVGGDYSKSLALIADAGHVFGDSIATMTMLLAAVLVKYGAQKQRVLDVAFWINIMLLFLVAIWIVFEAIERFQDPHEIVSSVMISVAVLGGVGNYFQHHVLEGAADEHKHGGHRVLSAHVIGDLMQNVAVVLGGIPIWIFGWVWIDPLLSIGIAYWIGRTALRLALDPHRGRHH